MSAQIHTGYVQHADGNIYVQRPADNQHGFELCDDDQSWPGGIGLGNGTWEALADDDRRITDEDRERLAWILAG